MNPKTAFISALACAAALAWGSAAAHESDPACSDRDAARVEERDRLRARLADYGLPPADALARDITRQIVDAGAGAPDFRASLELSAPPARVLPAAPAGRTRSPVVPAAAESDSPDSGEAPGNVLTRLRNGLRKIAGLPQLR